MIRYVFDERDRVGKWVANQIDPTVDWGPFYAMGVERDGEIVAGVVMNEFNGNNAACHIAISRPGKYIITLFEHFTDYAFNQCRLKRLTGMVPTSKPEVIKFDKHLGFQEEFVMKSAAKDGSDLCIMVLWPDENNRWLHKRGDA